MWWGESEDERGRPFLVVSRDAANEVMPRELGGSEAGAPSQITLTFGIAGKVAGLDSHRAPAAELSNASRATAAPRLIRPGTALL